MDELKRFNEIQDMINDWDELFQDAFSVMSDDPDRVTLDMRTRDIVKRFTGHLWNAKNFLENELEDGRILTDCVGIINMIYLFSREFIEAPKKIFACRLIAQRFVERIIYSDEDMLGNEVSVGFNTMDIDETEFCMHDCDEQKEIALLSMPVYFYDIKAGDISSVVEMLDELEEKGILRFGG